MFIRIDSLFDLLKALIFNYNFFLYFLLTYKTLAKLGITLGTVRLLVQCSTYWAISARSSIFFYIMGTYVTLTLVGGHLDSGHTGRCDLQLWGNRNGGEVTFVINLDLFWSWNGDNKLLTRFLSWKRNCFIISTFIPSSLKEKAEVSIRLLYLRFYRSASWTTL